MFYSVQLYLLLFSSSFTMLPNANFRGGNSLSRDTQTSLALVTSPVYPPRPQDIHSPAERHSLLKVSFLVVQAWNTSPGMTLQEEFETDAQATSAGI